MVGVKYALAHYRPFTCISMKYYCKWVVLYICLFLSLYYFIVSSLSILLLGAINIKKINRLIYMWIYYSVKIQSCFAGFGEFWEFAVAARVRACSGLVVGAARAVCFRLCLLDGALCSGTLWQRNKQLLHHFQSLCIYTFHPLHFLLCVFLF